MSIAAIRAAMTAALKAGRAPNVPNVRWYETVPDTVELPCGWVHLRDARFKYQLGATLGSTVAAKLCTFQVTVLFTRQGSGPQAQAQIDPLFEGSTAVELLLDNVDLTGHARTKPITRRGRYATVDFNGTLYVGAVFDVEVEV